VAESLLIALCDRLPADCRELIFVYLRRALGSKFRKNSGQNSGSGPFSGIFGPGVAGIIFLDIAFFWTF
jgi:hypothetical protein